MTMTPGADDSVLADVADQVEKGNAPQTKALVEKALAGGFDAWDVLRRGIMPALRILGNGLKDGDISLAEVMISVGAVKSGLSVLEPLLIRDVGTESDSVIVIGTVHGDVHSLGKSLIATLLKGSGFRVVDLGADVPPARFVEAVINHQAKIVAMSGLLTSSRLAMRETMAALKKAGLRQQVAVVVGGGTVDRQSAREIGADAFGEDAAEAQDVFRDLAQSHVKQ